MAQTYSVVGDGVALVTPVRLEAGMLRETVSPDWVVEPPTRVEQVASE